MNTKIHKHPTTNRRAPLPGTDTGSLRSRTRRRYPHRDRSHHINATTNQKAPSRNTGGSIHSHLTLNTNTKNCLPIGQAISHPEVPIGRRKLSLIQEIKAPKGLSALDIYNPARLPVCNGVVSITIGLGMRTILR
ncbi:hypothetical protein TNCV_463581 [Trichonephila clavipes]|nr:hypothetical protein TNCV_463581 [Trichonephila clavipes]